MKIEQKTIVWFTKREVEEALRQYARKKVSGTVTLCAKVVGIDDLKGIGPVTGKTDKNTVVGVYIGNDTVGHS